MIAGHCARSGWVGFFFHFKALFCRTGTTYPANTHTTLFTEVWLTTVAKLEGLHHHTGCTSAVCRTFEITYVVEPAVSNGPIQHVYRIVIICSIFHALIRSIINTEPTKCTAMLMMHFVCCLYNRIITFHIDAHSNGNQICIFRFADSFDCIYCLKNKHSSNVSVVS
jgi:hypothetical protein